MDSVSHCDFGFAFNNVNFSDRILRIEITNGGEITNIDRDLVREGKRIRKDVNTHGVEDENGCYLGKTSNPQSLRVKELHISSPILAARSPFFYKLFSNGMIETKQKHLTLRIDASEEAAVMSLLNFMYTNSLSLTEIPALLSVLMAADKFDVSSCMNYCTRWLLQIPMTLQYALLLLDLPWTVLLADSVKPLTNAATQYLATYYKDITRFPDEEVMALPLVAIKAILLSNDLMIASEDIVYEYVLKWAKKNYSVLEERQEVLSHLARYIRFPHMTFGRLKKILTSDDFKPSVTPKLVFEALLFKADTPHHQRVLASSLDHQFSQRAYIYKPIKVVEFEAPRPQCIVYLDLTRKECDALYPSSQINSQTFHLGGHAFSLSAFCNKDQRNRFHSFGLFLGTQERVPLSMIVDCKFSARSKPTEEFAKCRGNDEFTILEVVGYGNLFATPWHNFIDEDCPYFINDVLHLRAELSIRL